jgi:phenylpyruvate tautomerase PptA (4-oxalocrotonate tautomerase family)
MPLVKILISDEISEDSKIALNDSISDVIHRITCKPSEYIMILIEDKRFLRLGVKTSSALIEYSQLGKIDSLRKAELTLALTETVNRYTYSSPNSTYVIFKEYSHENWGFNGETFA